MPLGKPKLVMIGGVATDESLWDDQVAALRDVADCRPILSSGASIEAMAANVLTRLDGSFALVGHSMGGYVALAIQRAAPERVERLALIGSGANVESDAQREARCALMGIVRERGFDAMLDRLVPAMVGSDSRNNAAMMMRLAGMVRRAGAERFLREQAAVMHRPRADDALDRIGVPVLVLAGREDRIVPPEFAEAMGHAIPRADFRLIDRCGHLAPVERADIVSASLREWLLRD